MASSAALLTVVPAAVPPVLADRAVGLAMAVADALDYVGVDAYAPIAIRRDPGRRGGVHRRSSGQVGGRDDDDVRPLRHVLGRVADADARSEQAQPREAIALAGDRQDEGRRQRVAPRVVVEDFGVDLHLP